MWYASEPTAFVEVKPRVIHSKDKMNVPYPSTNRRPRCDRNHAIYMITCKVTGERYIGLTRIKGRAVLKSIKQRWKNHVYSALVEGRNHLFQQRIVQYGEKNFTVALILVVRGKKLAHQTEKKLVIELKPELNTELTERKNHEKRKNQTEHSPNLEVG